MSHIAPAALLVWSMLCCLLGAFLLFHLWSFDKFKCLKWNSGSSGTFKRVMTYSYLLTIPLLSSYAIGFCVIKYIEGFVFLPPYGVIPKPQKLWSQSAQDAVFPLMLLFSIGWSLEMVTHLEELCFWLFLVNASSSQQNWFQSMYFKSWVFGSIIAVVYMPLVTIFTRTDPLKSEAYTFLAGSLGDLSLTLWFTPILWTFPGFLRNLKSEGVDMKTMVRLTKFSELNTIRIVFRFLFVVPLLILAVDGIRPHVHVNDKMFATDLLVMTAGFGAAISSALTLVIFFPRSIEGEIADKEASMERKRNRSFGRTGTVDESRFQTQSNMTQSIRTSYHHPSSPTGGSYLLTAPVVKKDYFQDNNDVFADGAAPGIVPRSHSTDKQHWEESEEDVVADLPPIRPNRRKGNNEVQLGGIDRRLTENNLSKHNLKASNVNPLLHNFTSPINLMENDVGDRRKESWLTFSRV